MAETEIKIEPLALNGLSGRVLRADGTGKGSRILLVYGMHSSLERMASTAEWLSDYGPVLMPDLPGIGGMDSFYSIGFEPDLDRYADYLHTFLLLEMKKSSKPMAVVAMSFGFLVVTRMLQRHPDSRKWIKNVISFVGFGSSDDFKAHSNKLNVFISRALATKFGGWLVKTLVFNRFSLRVMFGVFRIFNPKYKHAMENNPDESLAMEMDLWQSNDARTRFALYVLMLTFDITKSAKPLDIPLHDVTTPTDQYFDQDKVARSLRKLYKDVSGSPANMKLHAPSIIGDKNAVDSIFSKEVKQLLKGRQV